VSIDGGARERLNLVAAVRQRRTHHLKIRHCPARGIFIAESRCGDKIRADTMINEQRIRLFSKTKRKFP